MLLESNPSIRVVGEHGDDEGAIEKVGQLLPDIILADFNKKPHNGFLFAEKIAGSFPSVKLICLSIKKGNQFVQQMLALGTRGYLTKNTSLEEIQRGILEVHRGKIYICDELKKLSPA